jgi:hypothetical protein
MCDNHFPSLPGIFFVFSPSHRHSLSLSAPSPPFLHTFINFSNVSLYFFYPVFIISHLHVCSIVIPLPYLPTPGDNLNILLYPNKVRRISEVSRILATAVVYFGYSSNSKDGSGFPLYSIESRSPFGGSMLPTANDSLGFLLLYRQQRIIWTFSRPNKTRK